MRGGVCLYPEALDDFRARSDIICRFRDITGSRVEDC